MKTTIDRAGRIVVPKAIREAARLEPGTELEVRLVGDVVELSPVPRRIQIEKQGSLMVAVPVDEDRELTQADVDAALRAVREREAEVPRDSRGTKS